MGLNLRSNSLHPGAQSTATLSVEVPLPVAQNYSCLGFLVMLLFVLSGYRYKCSMNCDEMDGQSISYIAEISQSNSCRTTVKNRSHL